MQTTLRRQVRDVIEKICADEIVFEGDKPRYVYENWGDRGTISKKNNDNTMSRVCSIYNTEIHCSDIELLQMLEKYLGSNGNNEHTKFFLTD